MIEPNEQQSDAVEAPRILSVDELLGVHDRPSKVVEMPEWGGAVKVQALSLGAFQDAQEAATVAGDVDEMKLAVELIVRGVVDPQLSSEHAAELRDKSIAAVMRLMNEIANLSGVTEEALKQAERQFLAATG
jgi:hypothetical protein